MVAAVAAAAPPQPLRPGGLHGERELPHSSWNGGARPRLEAGSTWIRTARPDLHPGRPALRSYPGRPAQPA